MNVQSELMAFILLLISQCLISGNAFAISTRCSGVNTCLRFSQNAEVDTSIDDASNFLSEWDRSYSVDNPSESTIDNGENARSELKTAIRLLKKKADEERGRDPAAGRVMLGICASNAQEGIQTLKSWVSYLDLPRGLLHGMDQDGVPLQLDGAVYIKYNSGGVYTFADIRKSQRGFDALWKPGDAMLEMYDGKYRGVYFQVELSDNIFRQYMVPLDTFGFL